MARIEQSQSGNSPVPTRIYMVVRDLPAADARYVAESAVEMAKLLAPKASGESSSKFSPIWGDGYFGIAFSDAHVWYQEMGIRPFTMHNLAGKTIPIWADDPDGKLRSENPRAEVRNLPGGRVQVLIFRKVALKGQRRNVVRKVRGVEQVVSVPMSYPGAPGRIANREAAQPWTTEGRVAGAIARRNVGVRWRHPGMYGKYFMREGLRRAAVSHGLDPGTVMYASEGVRARRQPLSGVREQPNPRVRGVRR